jgi:hypothetical protein
MDKSIGKMLVTMLLSDSNILLHYYIIAEAAAVGWYSIPLLKTIIALGCKRYSRLYKYYT